MFVCLFDCCCFIIIVFSSGLSCLSYFPVGLDFFFSSLDRVLNKVAEWFYNSILAPAPQLTNIVTLITTTLIHWLVLSFLWSSELKEDLSFLQIRCPVTSMDQAVSCRITTVRKDYKKSLLQCVRCNPSIPWALLILPDSSRAVGLSWELKSGNKAVNSFIPFLYCLYGYQCKSTVGNSLLWSEMLLSLSTNFKISLILFLFPGSNKKVPKNNSGVDTLPKWVRATRYISVRSVWSMSQTYTALFFLSICSVPNQYWNLTAKTKEAQGVWPQLLCCATPLGCSFLFVIEHSSFHPLDTWSCLMKQHPELQFLKSSSP